MAILDVVVAHVFVGERLIGLGEFDVEVVEGFNSLVLGWVRSNLIGMELEGESLVVRLDLLLIERLAAIVSAMSFQHDIAVAKLTSEIPRIS